MVKFGFHEIWVARIMQFISSVTYSFLHKGGVFGDLKPQSRLRQSGPITSYIYIMCAEGLSVMIRCNEEFMGIWWHLKLQQFPTFYLLMMHIFSFELQQRKQEVCRILNVSEVNIPGKYLDLPIFLGRNKVVEFGFFVDRIKQKLQMWRNYSISKAGQVTLLKTEAQTIPNFWMSLLLILSEVCDKIEKNINSFWWGNGSASAGIKWMSWDRLCMVKEDGGWGSKSRRSSILLEACDGREWGKEGGASARHKVWCKPLEGFIKVNIDATCHQGSELIGTGCVAHDDRGRFIHARVSSDKGRGHLREERQ
ncbi:uncharacterized protein LOC141689414 [Apium graveolens]|uniref:uncharacterized protein LOC141689414 n=1 Tax=Apium graveolens TaxID=4045 RepID=UPI003D7BDAF1